MITVNVTNTGFVFLTDHELGTGIQISNHRQRFPYRYRKILSDFCVVLVSSLTPVHDRQIVVHFARLFC